MFYLKPVSPWCAITFSQTGRQMLAALIALLSTLSLCICSLMLLILYQIWRTISRYIVLAGQECRPLLVTFILLLLHALTYTWSAISSIATARVSTRYRFSHYLSYTMLLILLLSFAEHWIFQVLYVGVHNWVYTLAVQLDRATYVYKYNQTARTLVDHVQRSAGCCGGTQVHQWRTVDWVPLRDSGFLNDSVISGVYNVTLDGASSSDEKKRLSEGLSERQMELAVNISRKSCPHCRYFVPWSCCDPDQNSHRCLDDERKLTWKRYNLSRMHNTSCLLVIYGKSFYRHLLDWGVLSELLSWCDLLLAVMLKYLDSATESVIMSGQPRGKSKGYMFERCCGWFCPKPGFLPERPPSTEPVVEELESDDQPSAAVVDILESVGNDWDQKMDEELEQERGRKQETRKERLEELRQQKIDAKVERRRQRLQDQSGVLTRPLLSRSEEQDEEEDVETDSYADD